MQATTVYVSPVAESELWGSYLEMQVEQFAYAREAYPLTKRRLNMTETVISPVL